jgi:CHAT domain-containing protein/Tfp pilus assembly protein PilF
MEQAVALMVQASPHFASKPDAAMPYVTRAIAIHREVYGTPTGDWLVSLDWLARQHERREEFAKARTLREELLRIETRRRGEGDWRAVDARRRLRDCLKLASLSAAQRKHLQETIRKHGQVSLLYQQGKPGEAIERAREVCATFRQILGPGHPHHAASLLNLAALHQSLGDEEAALPLVRQARAAYGQALGERHPHYATALNNLARLHQARGEYRQARTLYRTALGIKREALGERDLSCATCLNNLATIALETGDHQSALSLFKQATTLFLEVKGDADPLYALSLNNLAEVHVAIGDYQAALPLFRQALAVVREAFGKRSAAYATVLNNLASLYHRMKDHKAALPLYEEALALRKKVLGVRHPDYASSLNNLAALHQDRGEHKQSLAMYRQALELFRQVQGEKHPAYPSTLNNLAVLLQAMGDPAAAQPLYEQALAIRKEVLGEQHADTIISLNNLAHLFAQRRMPSQALPLCGKALALARQRLELLSASQSERQQLAAVAGARHNLDLLLSLSADTPEMTGTVHTEVLSLKGTVFARQQQARLAAGADNEVRSLLGSLQTVCGQLTTQVLAPEPARGPTRRKRLQELTREKEELEIKLAIRSEPFRRLRQRLTSAELARQLPADAALVDYLVYRHFGFSTGRTERRLAAFLVRPNQPVVRLELGTMAPIERAIASWRQAVSRGRVHEDRSARELREQLWVPLRKHLAGVKVVLVSPDEVLAQLPFSALPGDRPDSYLIEDVAVTVVPVPRLLPDLLRASPGAPSLLMVGDVDFDASPTTVLAKGEDPTRGPPPGVLQSWKALPGTRAEADAIHKTFRANHPRAAVTDLRGQRATRQATRQAMTRHSHVHLATHGFFAPAGLRSALERSAREDRFGFFDRAGVSGWHPGLLSGIVLAGANRHASPGQDEGLLTALEVAGTDLSRVELAVLSACQTGLGEVAGGDGLLGLQRAFQVAGARSVLASLWQVPDQATQLLMVRFYDNLWSKKMGKLEALRQAQLWLLREAAGKPDLLRGGLRRLPAQRPHKGRLPPYWWAAFVLSGTWT